MHVNRVQCRGFLWPRSVLAGHARAASGWGALVLSLFLGPRGAEGAIAWTKVGHPAQARKIAACRDGTIYALHADRTLWANSSGGADGGWVYVDRPGAAQSITCAENRVYAFNNDRTLWRFDGSLNDPSWAYVGTPWAAREVVAGTGLGLLIPYAKFFAVNDDRTLWMSDDGTDGSWRHVGTPPQSARLAAGGSLYEVKLFSIDRTYRSIDLNYGNAGCDDYWTPAGGKPVVGTTVYEPIEIAARSAYTLYVLTSDFGLWHGAVSPEFTSVTHGEPRSCLDAPLVDVHRLHLGNTDEVLTANAAEVESIKAVWSYQGVAFQCWGGPAPGTVPLYRLYHYGQSDHFYTLDPSKRDAALLAGYAYEGILCWVGDSHPHALGSRALAGICGLGQSYSFDAKRHRHTISHCDQMDYEVCRGYTTIHLAPDYGASTDGLVMSPYGGGGDCEGPLDDTEGGSCKLSCSPAPPPAPPPPPPPPLDDTGDVYLHSQPVIEGRLWWQKSYPPWAQPGHVTRVKVPAQVTGTLLVEFIKDGYSADDCDDPSRVVEVPQGSELSPSDFASVFGSPTPPLPVNIRVCAYGPWALDTGPADIWVKVTHTLK